MKHRPVIVLLAFLSLWLLLPDSALADNCSSLNDCYNTLRAALAAAVGVGVFATLLSIGLDFIPGVNRVRGIIEAITGNGRLPDVEQKWWDRALGIVPVGSAIAGSTPALEKAADKVAEAAEAAGTVEAPPEPAKDVDKPPSAAPADDLSRAGEAAADVTDSADDAAQALTRSGEAAPEAGRAADAEPISRAGEAAPDAPTADKAVQASTRPGEKAPEAGRATDAEPISRAGEAAPDASTADDAIQAPTRPGETAPEAGRAAEAEPISRSGEAAAETPTADEAVQASTRSSETAPQAGREATAPESPTTRTGEAVADADTSRALSRSGESTPTAPEMGRGADVPEPMTRSGEAATDVSQPTTRAGEAAADEVPAGVPAEDLAGAGLAADLGGTIADRIEKNFASEADLMENFTRFAQALGHTTPEAYLAAARRLTDGGEGVETVTQADGDTLFYRAATNEFGMLRSDGVIRTYFSPIDGMAFWQKQRSGG